LGSNQALVVVRCRINQVADDFLDRPGVRFLFRYGGRVIERSQVGCCHANRAHELVRQGVGHVSALP